MSALEYGGASAASILPLVLQLGANATAEEYSNIVIGPLVKLYASPDRGTRMALLDHLTDYAEKLDKKTVSDKIWPHLVRNLDLPALHSNNNPITISKRVSPILWPS